jgi:hypothetical protein
VFFFSCSCGSKVFFEMLGEPWPQHTCLASIARELRDAEGRSVDDVRRVVEAEARHRGVPVPPEAAAVLRTLSYRASGQATILELRPGGLPRDFAGTIRQANPRVNFFKRFSIPDTAVSRGLLRKLLGSSPNDGHAELFIRGDTNSRTGFCPQVVAFARDTLLRKTPLGIGVRVSVTLRPEELGPNARVWVVEALDYDR